MEYTGRRLAVRGIIIHEGKLLCLKLKAYGGRPASDFWCVPGGGINIGESIVDALHREMIEETGIEPVIGNLLYVQQYSMTNNPRYSEEIELFFLIKNSVDYLNIDLTKTTHGEEEITEIAFIDPASEYVLPKLLSTESFTDLDSQPPKFFSYLE